LDVLSEHLGFKRELVLIRETFLLLSGDIIEEQEQQAELGNFLLTDTLV
jgi:hypothetical protein